ncbi:cell division protein FtsL, partial [Roseomonas rosulenta]
MIRPLTLLSMAAAAGAGLYLYQVKHSVAQLDRELRGINRQTEQARERTQVLRAEWALLNEPDRLRQVAQRHLPLETMTPAQFVRPAEMERRLPPPRQFAGVPSLFAPMEPAGDGSATAIALAAAAPRSGQHTPE